MVNIFTLTECGDGTCCCLPLQTSTLLIAFISLIAGKLDAKTQDCLVRQPCSLQEHVRTFRQHLLMVFQAVNVLLVAAVAFEKICLLNLYILYTLSYVLMSTVVSIVDFLLGFNPLGLKKSLAVFVPDVAFLFVLSRCVPIVNDYKQQIEEKTLEDADFFSNTR